MPNYLRYRIKGGCYFFTVNLLERKSTLLIDHIDLLRESVRLCKQKRPFHIDAWVVLPEHMHCLWTLPEGDDDFSNRWKIIKTQFSKGLPKSERRSRLRITQTDGGRSFNATLLHRMDYCHRCLPSTYNDLKALPQLPLIAFL
jgi:putative transposase